MEIKESSLVSESGYYTISNGSDEGAVVVYCNMDKLSSCPFLEQTLSGIMKDVDSLITHIDGPLMSSCSEVKEKCPQDHCQKGFMNLLLTWTMWSLFTVHLRTAPIAMSLVHWVKVASWNISESGSSFPSGLQLFLNGKVSACGIQVGRPASCQSFPLFSSPVPYTQVCGTMSGY